MTRATADFPLFRGVSLFVLAFLHIPIAVLVAYAFNAGTTVAAWQGFSLRWFEAVLADANIQRAALNSLIVASVATILATSLALLAAIARRVGDRSGEAKVKTVINLPLMVPEVVTAVASLSFFVAIGLPLGLSTLIVAHTVFCIPFAYLPIKSSYDLLDPSIELAARDLYASPRRAFWSVTLPLLLPGVTSGAILAFIVSLDDFVISAMVSGAGSTTLPVHIYGMVRHGATPAINAISALLLSVSIALAILAMRLGAMRPAENSPKHPNGRNVS